MKKISVLVVEDESIVAKDIENNLKNLGYDVTECVRSGESAIISVEKKKPDLVLMDIMLQGSQSGIDTAEKVFKFYNIPVIFMTAYSDSKTLKNAVKAEPFGYLIKPFENTDLRNVIEVAHHKHKISQNIIKTNIELEKKVKERTMELEKTNQKLEMEIAIREKQEQSMEKTLLKLNEKIKELTSVSYSAQIMRSEMLRSHLEHDQMKEAKQKVFDALRVRVKELSLINNITGLLQNYSRPVDELMDELVSFIPYGFQYPNITTARLIINKKEYKNISFSKSPHVLEAKFKTKNYTEGRLEVYYLDDKPVAYEGPFIQEEKNLLNSITDLIKTYFEHKEAEEKIQQQLYLFQQLIDVIPNPVFYKDKNGIFLGCNKAFESFFNISNDKIIGKDIFNVFNLKRAEEEKKMDQVLLEHPGVQIYETTTEHQDQSIRKVVFNKATFVNMDNSLAGIVDVIIDITEHKKAEDYFLKRNIDLMLILDKLCVYSWTLTSPETFGILNQTYLDFLGKNRYEMESKNFYDIFSKREANLFSSANKKAFEMKTITISKETMKNFKKEKKTFSIMRIPKLDDNDEVEFVICIAREL